MGKNYMKKTTFLEVCNMMKNSDNTMYNTINRLLNIALLVFPALLQPELLFSQKIAIGTDLVGAKTAITDFIDCVHKILKENTNGNYYSKYERAQAAQALLVVTAFFDSIRKYLPDEYNAIRLSDEDIIYIYEESFTEYKKWAIEYCKDNEVIFEANTIINSPLDFKAPLESNERYRKRLLVFYSLLNKQFSVFFKHLSCWEEWNSQDPALFGR